MRIPRLRSLSALALLATFAFAGCCCPTCHDPCACEPCGYQPCGSCCPPCGSCCPPCETGCCPSRWTRGQCCVGPTETIEIVDEGCCCERNVFAKLFGWFRRDKCCMETCCSPSCCPQTCCPQSCCVTGGGPAPGGACCDDGCCPTSTPCCDCEPRGYLSANGYNGWKDARRVIAAADECADRALDKLEERRDICRDFECGFRTAYRDVALGGDGRVPAVPPKKFWQAASRTEEGHARADAWFRGYECGAEHALNDGQQPYRRIATPDDVGPGYERLPSEYASPRYSEPLMEPAPAMHPTPSASPGPWSSPAPSTARGPNGMPYHPSVTGRGFLPPPDSPMVDPVESAPPQRLTTPPGSRERVIPPRLAPLDEEARLPMPFLDGGARRMSFDEEVEPVRETVTPPVWPY